MRREELASLNWSNIDLERRTATLYQTKNDETRGISLSPKALKIFQSLKEETSNPQGKIFRKNKLLITQTMQKACKLAGTCGTKLQADSLRTLILNSSVDHAGNKERIESS
jgi:integrase